MLAVIKTGGKQYLVQPGDKIKVEKLDEKEGNEIAGLEVLLCDKNGDGQDLQIGAPVLKDVIVTAKIVSHGKGEKLIIFKYKPKKRYKRKIGHRQTFTEIEILGIK